MTIQSCHQTDQMCQKQIYEELLYITIKYSN